MSETLEHHNRAIYQCLEESPKRAFLHEIGHQEYHASVGLSSTFIKNVLRSPAHAIAGKADRTETPAMVFGTAVHCALLEPERFATAYMRAKPAKEFKHHGNSNAGRAERADWELENAGKILLTEKQFADIAGITEVVQRSKTMQWLLAGKREQACYWDHDGLLVKAKADCRTNGDLIVDVKTTSDARDSEFARSIINYGYHISAAHYCDGFERVTGDAQQFVLVAIEKEPPYGLIPYLIPPELLAIGRRLRDQALETWKKHLENGASNEIYNDDVREINLPAWYLRGFE